MHCKTDAINQVSLQCFIKSEGWSQGKSTVQILQIFTVVLGSWWCKATAQQSLTSASFWRRFQEWGDEQHLQSLYQQGILMGYPPWLGPAWHKAAVCSRKGTLCSGGGADSPPEVQNSPGTFSRPCCFFGSRRGKVSFLLSCPAAPSLTGFWLWLSTLQDLFVGGF